MMYKKPASPGAAAAATAAENPLATAVDAMTLEAPAL